MRHRRPDRPGRLGQNGDDPFARPWPSGAARCSRSPRRGRHTRGCRTRRSTGACCRVVQVGRLVRQKVGAGVGLDAFLVVQSCGAGSASDSRGEVAGVAAQHGQGPVVHPCLGGGVTFSEEVPHRAPEIFQYVDEGDHDGDVDVSGVGCCFDPADLMVVPSTRATQRREWSGSRRSASSKTFAITVAASWTTLAVTHFASAFGAGAAASPALLASPSVGVPGTGVRS